MRKSKVTTAQAEEQFWSVVEACLREFHHQRPNSIAKGITKLHNQVKEMPPQAIQLFYHAEPFDVACRVADKDLDVRDYLPRYLEIRDGDAGLPSDVE